MQPLSPAPGPAPERVAIFGGSFDPVHRGHLFAARAALEAFGLDRVLFVPARVPPHKRGRELAPEGERAAMLAIALRDEPRFSIETLELERAGPSYTIDTVRELERRFAAGGRPVELFLVIGDDNVADLASWRSAEELLLRARPIVVRRAGDLGELLAGLRGRIGDEALRRLERGLLRVEPVAVDASSLRELLRAGGDPGDALPPGVLEHIRARGLYRGRP